jgi:hypothetical protein
MKIYACGRVGNRQQTSFAELRDVNVKLVACGSAHAVIVTRMFDIYRNEDDLIEIYRRESDLCCWQ